ncbi:MAG TPA: protein phosphatase 2C domain-containing protein [Thermomicrobiales bacterium]|nr:protein phosphatase 2C domain-containing protein [Thermomicrobiales bacterium]
MAISSATDRGGRPENEDAVFVSELPAVSKNGAEEQRFLLAVADGMGGHEGGEVASHIAIETLKDALLESVTPPDDMALAMKQAFRRANERIFEEGQALGDGPGMGTTLVAAATLGKYATIASVGDSRAYLVRANRLTQITKDHSLVAQQVEDGSITAREARSSPRRNVLTHALGQSPKLDSKLPNVFEITLLPEDRLLLCTDGFYDVASDDDLLQVALAAAADNAASSLVMMAKERGTTDNVTAVVASVSAARVREPMPVGAGRPTIVGPVLVTIIVLILIAVLAATYYFFLM